MDERITRVIRTVSAFAIAWLLLQFKQYLGVELPNGTSEAMTEALVVLLGAVIYSFVAFGSKYWPWLEWLLVIPKQPSYSVESAIQKEKQR